MASSGLTSEFLYDNIEVKNINSKTSKSCKTEESYYQKEPLKKSAFQRLQLLWVLSFGPMSMRRKTVNPVDQEVQFGHSAFQTDLNKERSERRSIQDFIEYTKLNLSAFLYSVWSNKRLKWGLILFLIVAPTSMHFYKLFPEVGFGDYFYESSLITIKNNIEGPHWYYSSLYYWLWDMGTLIAPMIAMYGIFLLFPKNYYPSYFVGIPFGYFISLLVHRATVNSTEEYHQGFGMGMVGAWIILGIVVFVLSDKFLFSQNHRKRSVEARIVGLINAPGIGWKEKEELLKKEAKQWQKNENELFTRTG